MPQEAVQLILMVASLTIITSWIALCSLYRKLRPASLLAYLALIAGVAGMLAGNQGPLGYALMVAGIVLVAADAFIKWIDLRRK